MRYVQIDKALPGMVLSKGIYDDMDRTLLEAGKVLNEENIRKLENLGYSGIYIEDDVSIGIDVKDFISQELRNRIVYALRTMDIDRGIQLSKKMVDEITKAPVVYMDALDLRNFDDYTFRHSVNVAALSLVIGMGLNYSYEDLVDLCIAALFHDIGKMRLDKDILEKTEKLTVQEIEIIKSHPKMSYSIVSEKWSMSPKIQAAILCHHENEDGSGYPLGLTGDKIHPFAKIIHAADVYDALTSKRPYKGAYSSSESLEYLMAGCGTLFDKNVVEAFLKFIPVYPKGITVELSDGRTAVVMENYPESQLRPKLRLMNGSILNLQDLTENRNITILRQSDAILSDEIEKREKQRNQKINHILVVDHIAANLRDMKRVLEDDYKVSLVESGKEAIAFVRDTIPDLIIMDVQMPDKNGIETMQDIRLHIPEEIPVIFISAFADVKTVMSCRSEQAADFILKPFKASYLRQRIRLVLGEE